MALLDDAFAIITTTLLSTLGTTGELVVIDEDYVPEEGISAPNPGSPTSYPLKMAPPQDTMISVGGGVLVKTSKIFFRMDDITIVPNAEVNQFRFGGQTYEVSSFEPVYSGDLIAGWWAILGA